MEGLSYEELVFELIKRPHMYKQIEILEKLAQTFEPGYRYYFDRRPDSRPKNKVTRAQALELDYDISWRPATENPTSWGAWIRRWKETEPQELTLEEA